LPVLFKKKIFEEAIRHQIFRGRQGFSSSLLITTHALQPQGLHDVENLHPLLGSQSLYSCLLELAVDFLCLHMYQLMLKSLIWC
jgi:hypothetical protein